MSKRYQKKSASRKKRSKKGSPHKAAESSQATGVMGGMIQGFRRAVGTGEKTEEKKGGSGLLWTAVLVVVAAGFLAWNFSR